ncbi:hypothetical protein [Sorangium sp. So ce131]
MRSHGNRRTALTGVSVRDIRVPWLLQGYSSRRAAGPEITKA